MGRAEVAWGSEYRSVASFPMFTHYLVLQVGSAADGSSDCTCEPISMCSSGNGASSPIPANLAAMRLPSPSPIGFSNWGLIASPLAALCVMVGIVRHSGHGRSTETSLLATALH